MCSSDARCCIEKISTINIIISGVWDLKAKLKLKTIEMHDFCFKKNYFNFLCIINVGASDMLKNGLLWDLKVKLKFKTIEMHGFSHKSKQTFSSLYVINIGAPDMPKNGLPIMIE